jgi:hypothetical protein
VLAVALALVTLAMVLAVQAVAEQQQLLQQ